MGNRHSYSDHPIHPVKQLARSHRGRSMTLAEAPSAFHSRFLSFHSRFSTFRRKAVALSGGGVHYPPRFRQPSKELR